MDLSRARITHITVYPDRGVAIVVNGREIARLFFSDMLTTKEADAYLKLFATSPEMLRALKKLVGIIQANISSPQQQRWFENSQDIKLALDAIKEVENVT